MGWFNAEKRKLSDSDKKRIEEIKQELKKLDKVKDKVKRQKLIAERYNIEYGNTIN